MQVFAEIYVYVQVFTREFENPSINGAMCMCRFQNAIYTMTTSLKKANPTTPGKSTSSTGASNLRFGRFGLFQALWDASRVRIN